MESRDAVRRQLATLLPGRHHLVTELLGRWSEPHRRYHGVQHLSETMAAATALHAGRAELVALAFHDAVHTGRPGDEEDSAALASVRLAGDPDLDEVVRLVLLTRHHRPEPDDLPGARVCDADLWVLAAPRPRYAESVSQLRRESALPYPQWRELRLRRLEDLLTRDPLFHTAAARDSWQPRARTNLTNEQGRLRADDGPELGDPASDA